MNCTRRIEIVILSIITGIFIYYRRVDYYQTIPRKNILASFVVVIWCYLTLQINPWFLLVGLALLNVCGVEHDDVDIAHSNSKIDIRKLFSK